MKFVTRILVLPAVIAATLASAQTLPPFKHIVIIVQENRTPDNLFGAAPGFSGCGREDPFEAGVDIQDGGLSDGAELCNQPVHLATCWDIDHSYGSGWRGMWNGGKMDGACHIPVYIGIPTCTVPACPAYSYVIKSDVQPYFDIATNYGFANYRGC